MKTLFSLLFFIFTLPLLAEEPLLFYRDSSRLTDLVSKPVILFTELPDTLRGSIQDFMPDEVKATCMINFCNPFPIQFIDPFGRFKLTKPSPDAVGNSPWLIEGVNTVTLLTQNSLGLLNRQTSIFQVFTTPPRVTVTWPPWFCSLKQWPEIHAFVETLYDNTTTLGSHNISFKINGDSVFSSSYQLNFNKANSRVDFKCLPEWPKYHDPVDKEGTLHLSLKVNASAFDAGSNTKDFNASWQLIIDTVAPKLQLRGDSILSSKLDSDLLIQLDCSDNRSILVKDITINLFKIDKTKWEQISKSSRYFPEFSCGIHSVNIFPPKPSFFSNLDGLYALVVRGRDEALLDSAHFADELTRDRLIQQNDPVTLARFLSSRYEARYTDKKKRFNAGTDTLFFRIDNQKPVIAKETVSHTEFTHAHTEKGEPLTVQAILSEAARVQVRALLSVHAGDESAWIEMAKQEKNGKAGTLSFSFDLSSTPSLLPDGQYCFAFTATDEAGNSSDTLLTDEIIIDQTAPIIRYFALPSLVINGKEKPVPSGTNAMVASKLNLSFEAFDAFSGDTTSVTPSQISLFIVSPEGAEKAVPNGTALSGSLFDKGDGVYYLKGLFSDKRKRPNQSVAQIPVVKGCVPPQIISPSPLSDVGGTIALRGVAQDPDWTDNIPFSHYELEYRSVTLSENGMITNASDWEITGMSVPTDYRNRAQPLNLSNVPVTRGNLLAYWDTRVNAVMRQGYYQVRLLVYDRNFHPELGNSPLNDPQNNATWAADTLLYYLYNDTAFISDDMAALRVESPTGPSLDFATLSQAPLGFTLSDPSAKCYEVTLSVRDTQGNLVCDTLFKTVSGDDKAKGAPSDFNRLGYFIYYAQGLWHIRWNPTKSSRTFAGFLRFNGPFTLCSGSAFLKASQSAQTEKGVSLISFSSDMPGAISFESNTESIDFKLNMTPSENQDWIFLGSNRVHQRLSTFTLFKPGQGRTFFWNGKNRYGFYPPPGRFSLSATAAGINGFGYVEATTSLTCRFPFGIQIDHLSDTLFEIDTGAIHSEASLYFRPFSHCLVSGYLLCANGSTKTLFKDTLCEGISPDAKADVWTWNFNINGNQLVPNGRYRFILKAVPPEALDSLAVYDTSSSFRIQLKKALTDPHVAELDMRGDTLILSEKGLLPVITGNSDYRFSAEAKGRLQNDLPFSFTTALAGQQSVQAHGFERFTVKARRGFKTLNYKVRMWLESGHYLREIACCDRSPNGSRHCTWDGYKYSTTRHTDKLIFTDRQGASNKHRFYFSAETHDPGSTSRQQTFFHGNGKANIFDHTLPFPKKIREQEVVGLPKLHIYFLPNSFHLDENPENWAKRAWETLEISYDNANSTDTFFAKNATPLWQSKLDSSILTDEDYQAIKDSNIKGCYDGIRGTNYSQFYVLVKGRDRCCNSYEKTFFNVSFDLEFGTRKAIWDEDFSRHGYNSLVNRYTTWDSENSIFFNNGKGIVAKDGFDNNFDGKADNPVYSPKNGSRNFPEDGIKYISDHHQQGFDFKYLSNPKSDYAAFYFSGLEGTSPSVENPFWEFKRIGKPDVGKYGTFKWAKCFDPEKSGKRMEEFSSCQDTFIHIDSDKGPRSLLIWAEKPMASANLTYNMDWPITPARLDTINHTRPELGGLTPLGATLQQRFVPPFGAGVRYGLQDGLDTKPNDGKIDTEYQNPLPESLTILLTRLNVPLKNSSLEQQATLTLLPDGRFGYEYVIQNDAIRFGQNVTPFARIESYQTNGFPLTIQEKKEESGLVKMVFTLADTGNNWSTQDDPRLAGPLLSDPVTFNENGFASLNRCYFASAYPKTTDHESNTNAFSLTAREAPLQDNPRLSINQWTPSLQHINGEPNRDLVISSIDNGPSDNSRSDLLDCFIVRLKDNVFTPRKMTEVIGIAHGDSYKLLVRQGNGWDKIVPLVEDKTIHQNTANKRTLAYWDLSDRYGGNTLLLQVKKGNQLYQACQELLIGTRLAPDKGGRVLSTHGRGALDIPAGALSDWGDTAVVSLTARKLDELNLSTLPTLPPIGPIMEIQPSPVHFSPEKRPRLTLSFTYTEVKSNGWLNKNLNLYSLGANGELEIISNSVTSYHQTDTLGVKGEPLPNLAAFKSFGDSSKGLALMEIAAEPDHWSTFALIHRPPRTLFVDLAAPSNGNGRSWKTAFHNLSTALEAALSGDTLKLAGGKYVGHFVINKNLIILGKIVRSNREATVLQGQLRLNRNVSFSNIIFDATGQIDTLSATFRRCLFLKNLHFNEAQAAFTRCTFSAMDMTSQGKGNLQFNGSLLQGTKISGAPLFSNCAAPHLTPQPGILYADDPQTHPDFRLKRNSPLIDVCPKEFDSRYFGLAPDIGFDEFLGDTLFVSEALGQDSNTGKSRIAPAKSLETVLKKVQAHDLLLLAQGSYQSSFSPALPFFMLGGYADDFSSRSVNRFQSTIRNGYCINSRALFSGLFFSAPSGTALSILNPQPLSLDSCLFLSSNIGLFCAAPCSLSLSNITFHANGAALSAAMPPVGLLRNSLFNNNGADLAGSSGTKLSISHNLTFQSGSPLPLTGTTNFSADPRLANPSANNLHPLPNSPCLHRGENRSLIGALGPKADLSDKILLPPPRIRISGVPRYASGAVCPKVEFLHTLPSDSCCILMNDTLVKSDSLYYLEGRYQLTAKLFSDNRCIDTSLSFVIDMTPPDIRFLGLPEKPVVVCTDPFLKKSNTTLNGKPLPLQGTRLHHLGDYRLAASAEDSAGNRADKEAYFTLLPADAPLTLIVTSHADENFTNTFYDTLCGWVNSNAINLTINGDSVRSLSLYRDSTRFSYPVRLISGSNYFEIKAASRITTQSASKSIAIHSDTLSPTVTILSPLPGSRHASDINLFSIPITGEVKCNGLLTSVQLKSGWMNMAADFQKIGDNRYSFSGSIGVRGENSRYPVSVEAINQYGNRTLSTVIIAIGQKPRLLPPSPPSNSGTNAPLITISGKIIEPNLRTLSIQNVPVSFTQAGDTACYAGEILLPTASANNIFITAEDSIGFRDSLNLIINRDIAPPTAAISFPTDNYTTQESLLTITGTLDDPYAFVWANNDTADYPSGPLFQIQNFRLTEGNNTLTIQCQDTVGNIGNTITLQVTRLSSNIIHVNNSYQGTEDGTAGRPFTTLTKGLNASTQGTLLLIHGGTYHESGSFKAGMIIQGVDKPVWLDGGSSGYTASGVLYLDHINMMGQGDWLLSASSGNRFSATVCTLATTGSGGWALSGYARVDINNVHIRTRLSGNGLSVSACDSLFLSNFRIDSSAQSGIHVATAPFVRIDHCLFQHCGLAGLTLTQCGSQVEFSTFSENLSAIALSQGTLLLKNSILVNNTAYAINRSNVPALTLQYNDFFGNNLGLSQNPSDLNDLSNIFSSPLFINKTDFLLQDASPAKNSGENGCEMGLHGFPKLSRKAASTLLISPQSDCFVNNTVRLIASQNRLESNYQLPTILYQGKWQPVLPVPDSLPDQVWGLLKTAPYPAGKYTLRLGRYTLPIRIGLPEWVREIPMKDTTIQTFKPQCHSGNLTYSLKKHTLFCHDQYDNLLFSFDGFGKAPYRFDSPKGIAVADSFLFVADEGNQRIMVYKIIPGNPAKEKALSADINSPLLSIKDCHFIPSPFRPEKEKGYIRYRLSRPAEVTITLFDLAGFKVREWHFDPGERGGKMGVNEIAWNGRNGDSRMVVDGAYVFRVSAKTGSERAKSLVKMMKR